MVVLSLALGGAAAMLMLAIYSALGKADERWPWVWERLINWIGLFTVVTIYSALVLFVLFTLGAF